MQKNPMPLSLSYFLASVPPHTSGEGEASQGGQEISNVKLSRKGDVALQNEIMTIIFRNLILNILHSSPQWSHRARQLDLGGAVP